ncbi:hypothetical protein [Cloacibacillus sp.]|uniref:hypothetical protein n=1 Tax=Cloacibacillus sp. TaxID=2049023 RepID=UPI0025BFBB06|nr:hypothetical protein [Cloacibacillus sp.]
MAVIGRSEHLQEENRVIFLNISKVIYGDRCESAKNDDAQLALAVGFSCACPAGRSFSIAVVLTYAYNKNAGKHLKGAMHDGG